MEEYHASLTRNIRSLFWVHIGSGMMLSIAVIVPFLQSNGMSLKQVFLIQSIFAITLVSLEIPSGYLSDRWGRVHTVIAGSVFGFLGYLTYALSETFTGFLGAEILLAIGLSLYSGTLEALTYDSLLGLGKTELYRKINGTQLMAHFGAEAVGGLLGGALALFSLRTPFWCNLLPFAVACIASFTLTEPHRHKLQETRHWKAILDICTHTLVTNAPLRWVTVLHACIAALTLTLFWFTQPYELDIGMPIAFFGIAHAVMVGCGAVASGKSNALQTHMDDRWLLSGIALTVAACYLTLAFVSSVTGLIFFLLARIAWGILTPVTNDMVNRMTTSDIRATTLSIKAMGSRLIFAILAPFIGSVADLHGLSRSFLLIGIGGSVVFVAVFIAMRSVWSQIPK